MDSTSLVDSLLTALGGNKPKDLYLSDSSEEAVKIFIAGFRRYEVSVDSPVTLQSCVEPSLFAVLELSVDGFSSSSSNEKNLKALQTFIGAPDDLSVFRKLIPLSLQEQDLTATTLKTKFISYAASFSKVASEAADPDSFLNNREVLVQFASGLSPTRFGEDILTEVRLLIGGTDTVSFAEVMKLVMSHISVWSYSDAFWHHTSPVRDTSTKSSQGTLCFRCWNTGHFANKCPNAPRDKPDHISAPPTYRPRDPNK
eukprot:TRINITY_DN195_c0_g1_i10.p1 TRINITY_DN195_c0_g1~~TRINITY_DN195_c0_g1_i10.p1  ORF type:complete len:256 (+),score=42.56 TRINITY_DN195_c0_g1_i10:1204-1971(+)